LSSGSLRLHRRIAPDNARALTGLATFRVVGKPEVIHVEPISNDKSASRQESKH
jgi:hypothetical protein